MRKMLPLSALLIGLLTASTVDAQLPTVNTGGSVFVYAAIANGPAAISFDAFDNLFVGNYNSSGDPGVAVSVWVVGPADSFVSTCATIDDPDAVYVDRNGLLSDPGALLVGGLNDMTDVGRIMRVLPTCGGVALQVSSGLVNNVGMFAEDGLGNLYVANAVGNTGPSRTVCKWDGVSWSLFLPAQATDPFIAIDGTDIYISVSGTVRRYDTSGNLVDPSFALGNVVAIGPVGSDFEGVVVGRTDMLLAIDPVTKVETPILTGPGSTGFVAFDSVGDLYVSQSGLSRILHVTQCNCVVPVETSARRAFDIVGVVPNPFNPNTSVRFTLPSAMNLDAGIWSVTGERIVMLVKNQAFPAGESEIRWDGRNGNGQRTASGVYFFRLTSPAGSRVARLVLLE